jgi:hypothetical protein
MQLSTAIEEAKKEAESLHVTVLVVESSRGLNEWPYFPCRKDWMEGYGHSQGYRVVAEAYPNGKVWRAK